MILFLSYFCIYYKDLKLVKKHTYEVKVTVLGAAKEVGRSAFLVTCNQTSVLLDYGILLKREPHFPSHVRPKDIDGVVISHAHLDHSGFVPSLFLAQSNIPVVAFLPQFVDPHGSARPACGARGDLHRDCPLERSRVGARRRDGWGRAAQRPDLPPRPALRLGTIFVGLGVLAATAGRSQ